MKKNNLKTKARIPVLIAIALLFAVMFAQQASAGLVTTQKEYRWLNENDTAISAQNTPYSLGTANQAVHMRLGINASNLEWKNVPIQLYYSTSGLFSGEEVRVTNQSARVKFWNDTDHVDKTLINASGSAILTSTTSPQHYVESYPSAAVNVPVNQQGEWDFALNFTEGGTYYLRACEDQATYKPLTAYNMTPQFTVVQNHLPSFYETTSNADTTLFVHFEGNYQGENGEQGTESGTTLTTGKVGSGVLIDSGDSLTYNTAGNIDIHKGTIEMWVKPTWSGTDGAHHDFFSMARSNVDRIRVRKSANNYIECSVLGLTGQWAEAQYSIYNIWQPNEWHYVACVWDDSTDSVYLYIDNQLVAGSTIIPFEMGQAGNIMYIGTEINGAHAADSIIDELMISNSTNRTFVGTALIYPVDKQVIEANTTYLDWKDASDRDNDAITYRLVIDNNSNFASPELNISGRQYSNYTLNLSQALRDGDYWWQVVPYDGQAYGNRSAEEWYFTIDSEFPNILNTTYMPSTPYNNDSITFYATITNDTNLSMVWYSANWSGTQQNYTAGIQYTGGSYNATIHEGNFSDQEQFNFRWYVNQTNGKSARGEQITARIRNRAPDKPNGIYPSNWQFVNSTSTWLNWSNSSDPDFGYGCEFGGCNLTFYLYAGRDIGNVSSDEPSSLVYNGSNLYYNFSGLAASAYYWKIVASDGIERNSSSLYTFTNDGTPPVIRSLNASPNPVNHTQNVVLTANITDDGGVEFAKVQVSGINYSMLGWGGNIWNYTLNTSILSPGTHSYTVYANDTSRNSATPVTSNFTIVEDVPFVTINNPSATTYTYTYIQISIIATDPDGVDKIWYNFNGTNISYTGEAYFNFTDNRAYTFYAYANDTSGGIGSSSVAFIVNTSLLDTTPPQMNVSASPTNQSAAITANTSENANATLNFGSSLSLGNRSYNTSFTLNRTFTVTGLSENTIYYYNMTCCDSSGNCNTTGPHNFTTSDLTPPIISGITESITNESAAISWITNENANSTINYNTTVTLGNYTYNTSATVNHSILIPGLTENTTYYYNITSCDSSGNCVTNGSYSFTTASNTKSPPVVNRNVSPTVFENGTGTNLTIYVTDTYPDKAWVVITQPNSTLQTIFLTNGTKYQYNNTYQTGRYNLTFYANDTLGNTASNTTSFYTGVPINATLFTDKYDGDPLNATLRLLTEDGQELSFLEVFGNTSDRNINVSYDFRFKAFNDTITVKLNRIPLSDVDGRRIRIDMHTETSGYLVTYSVNTTFPYTDLTLTLVYNETSYTNESRLEIYKCDNYTIHTRTCNSGWYNITGNATQDFGADTFTITLTSLSGFSIKEVTETAPGGGGGGGGGGYIPPKNVTVKEEKGCAEDWVCEDWGVCNEEGFQERDCYDWAHCGTIDNKPITARSCVTENAEEITAQAVLPVTEKPEEAKPRISWIPFILLALVLIGGTAVAYYPRFIPFIYAPQIAEVREWIWLKEQTFLPEKVWISDFKINEKKDFKEVIRFVREWPAVVFIDTKQLRIKDIEALKSAVRALKKTVNAEGGSILGLEMDYILATSRGIKITRPAEEADDNEGNVYPSRKMEKKRLEDED